MHHTDLAQVYEIERQCFTAPWSINSFKYELEHETTILKVGVLNEQVIGYVCLRTILDITHVLNIAVLPKFRRRGVGSMLLSNALQELKQSGLKIKSVTLEVRESNLPAIRLYEKFGFKITGRRGGYYHSPDEDAVLMCIEMGKE